MKYELNMVRQLRWEERRAERKRITYVGVTIAGFGLLLLSIFYAGLQALAMERLIANEQREVARLEADYRQYRQTEDVIEKDDVELLDNIHRGRTYWTRKLVALANHLPDDYRLDVIKAEKGKLTVQGLGAVSQKQNQLIVLNEYLARLRADPLFNDLFHKIYLTSSSLVKDAAGDKIKFEFVAEK